MRAPKLVSRRDFLKAAVSLPLAAAVGPLLSSVRGDRAPSSPNIILIVFDAWAAGHLSMYGYPRRTMPHLENFADNALVFHRHYSAGTFTVPGTASLLTGLHPWTHRALHLDGRILAAHRNNQIFRVARTSHGTLGFAQNEHADVLLSQMAMDLDEYPPSDAFSLQRNLVYTEPFLRQDLATAHVALEKGVFRRGVEAEASLFLGPLRRALRWRATRIRDAEYKNTYPRGLPVTLDQFSLEGVVDGVIDLLGALQEPSFVYLHLYPPHGFYRPKGKFNRSFDDGLEFPAKPSHDLSWENPGRGVEATQRLRYDQYLASWDSELARLFEFLKASELLANSYVVFTSDHGEMFERGVVGHYTRLIYDPLLRIPLIVLAPNHRGRVDIRTPTSSVDLLPTLAALAGATLPAWSEGRLLPGLGGVEDPDRSVFAVDAKTNSAFERLGRVSVALTNGQYRLAYYAYPEDDYHGFELYDLTQDPEELRSIYSGNWSVARHLRDELLEKLGNADAQFQADRAS